MTHETPGPDGYFWVGVTNALAINLVIGGLIILVVHLL
jgi:hypothetical protein